MSLVEFYMGTNPDSSGRLLSEYLEWSDEELEKCHDWVQWAFPIPERSLFNPTAPLLSPDDILIFRDSEIIQENLSKMFERFFEFARKTSGSWEKHDHNHLRISRVLRCLKLCGRVNDAVRLYLWSISLPPTNTNPASKRIWGDMVRN